MKKLIALILWALICPQIALAQGPTRLCYTIGGDNCVPAVQTIKSVPIATSTATTTQLVALVARQNIFVTSFNAVSAGTNTFKLVYGTGTTCGTGTTDLTGVYTLVANGYVSTGSGLGSVLVVPPGNALCIVTTQAVVLGGSLSYAQF
jgi:hypothetical protein